MCNNTSFGTFDKIEAQESLVLFVLDQSAIKFKELYKIRKP